MKKTLWQRLSVSVMMMITLVLGACQPANTPVAGTQALAVPTSGQTNAQPTAIPAAPTTVQPTSAPAATSGGTLVIGLTSEPSTLDPSKMSWSDTLTYLIGGSLVYLDESGNYVPYLAESWKVSPDGLVWDFSLRKDVKFHNGEPLTAKEYAWTYQRAIDPKTASPAAGPALGDVKSIEAVGDYTLRITLNKPNFPLLYGLQDAGFMAPLPPDVVEKMGDDFGRHPVSVGPYKFKEWVAGEKIVLERNPDFAWPPEPWKNTKLTNAFDTIEFRFIPEYSTVLSGLESGDIDFAAIQAKDVQMIKDSGKFQVFNTLTQGTYPALFLNVSKPPFDDLRIRQAFNFAVDRDPMIKIAAQGYAEPQKGPLSSSVIGYWKGIEDLGYGFDIDKAKSLMGEAGYQPGGDGILAKGGKALQLNIYVEGGNESFVKLAEVLKEQYKKLGVDLNITVEDTGVLYDRLSKGNFEISLTGQQWGEADTMYYMFHSSQIGGFNWSFIKDADLDKLLDLTRSETDPAKRQEAVNETAKMVVEKAIIVPLYAQMRFYAMSNRIEGETFNKYSLIQLWSAHVQQ